MPFSRMTLGMLRGEDRRPRLRLKAAKTRALLPITAKMLAEHFVAVTEREKRRQRCVEFLVKAYDEIDHWRVGSPARLEAACRKHLLLYSSLAREAVEQQGGGSDWISWRVYPKHHMLLHLVEQSSHYGSPRTWWCYADEGSIGLAVRIAQTTHPRTLVASCWEKYQLLASVE